MISTFEAVVLLGCSPLLLFLVHIVLSRLGRLQRSKTPPLFVALLAVPLCFALLSLMTWKLYLRHLTTGTDILCGTIYCVVVYACLSYAYLHVFNMSETARRIRILYELRTRGRMTRNQIVESYHPEVMLAVRLERLLDTQQIIFKNNHYALKKYFLYHVSIILAAWGSLIGYHMDDLWKKPPDEKLAH